MDYAFNAYGQVTFTGQGNLRGTQRVRVLELGVGVPPGLENIASENGPDQGWLRVVELHDEAGAASADGPDAGSADAGPDAVVLGTERFILGPLELGQLPLAIGDELEVSDESRAVDPFNYDQRIVIRQAGRTLLMRQYSTVGERMFGLIGGVLLARGALICSAPVGAQPDSDARCADMNVHDLEVTVPIGPSAPGGATATLGAGEEKTIGDYHVIHGNTYQIVPPSVYAYGKGCVSNAGAVIVTVVFTP